MRAAISLPAFFRVFVAHLFFLAVTHRLHTVRGNSERSEEALRGVCAALAKAEVVLGGAALVAIAFDHHFHGRIGSQILRGARESIASIGANVRAVEIEKASITVLLNAASAVSLTVAAVQAARPHQL